MVFPGRLDSAGSMACILASRVASTLEPVCHPSAIMAARAASARVDRPRLVGVPAAPTSMRLSAPSGCGLSGAKLPEPPELRSPPPPRTRSPGLWVYPVYCCLYSPGETGA